jgi:NAD-dependent dihydropyrimidine dehydrogenase PreA subunit
MIFFGPLKLFYINEGEVNKLAHTISDECINCGACDDSCPVGAIAEAGGKRVIDADNCIDCGACVDTCPVNAISG